MRRFAGGTESTNPFGVKSANTLPTARWRNDKSTPDSQSTTEEAETRLASAARPPSALRTGSGSSRRLFLSVPGGLLFLSPLLDAAAVADPDSHSLLIPGPLDALAGFQASFSDALRGELHWLAAMRAGERQCRFRHAARIAGLSRSTEKLRRVPAGARHGPQAILLLRAGLAVVGVGHDPRPAT